MKTIYKFTTCLFICLMILSSQINAHVFLTQRKNCNLFAKYSVTGIIAGLRFTPVPPKFHLFSWSKSDRGCTYAEVSMDEMGWNFSVFPFQQNRLAAHIHVRIGTNPIYECASYSSLVGAGSSWKQPLSPNDYVAGPNVDTTGVAKCSMLADVDIADGTPGNTIVTLSNFTGSLVSLTNSNYGSAFLYCRSG